MGMDASIRQVLLAQRAFPASDAQSEPRKKNRLWTRPRIARASAMGHHGEILQGVFETGTGRLMRGLVTLAAPQIEARATYKPTGADRLRVVPEWKSKALRAAELTLDWLQLPQRGVLKVSSDIQPQWGFGSSTTDVVAAVRAVAGSVGVWPPAELVARLAVEAETASDSTMYGNRAVLFAQRNGVVIEDLGGAIPTVLVVGFNTDPSGEGVNTLEFPPARYTAWEIEAFRPLLGLLRHSVRTQDAAALGRVTSASAWINQRFLRTPKFEKLESVVSSTGALGLQVAHSGSLAGVLVQCDASAGERVQAIRRKLCEIGIDKHWCFTNQHA